MTTEEIIYGNKLIAEYMGGTEITNHYEDRSSFRWSEKSFKGLSSIPSWASTKVHGGLTDCYGGINSEFLAYHKSWDWIMPVVKKINSVLHQDRIVLDRALCKVDLSATHKAVVEFIKIFNEKVK